MGSLEGDTKIVRDLGYVSWKDPLAPMESSKGALFQTIMKQETTMFQSLLKGIPHLEEWKDAYKSYLSSALPATPEYAYTTIPWIYDTRIAKQKGRVWILHESKVVWKGEALIASSYSEDGLFAIIEDIGSGSQSYQLIVYQMLEDHTVKQLWKRSSVGPDVHFYQDQVLYLGVDVGGLRYPKVFCTKALDGSSIHMIHEETDGKVQCELIKPFGQPTVFLRTSNSLLQQLYRIEIKKEARAIPLCEKKYSTLIPLSDTMWLENDRCVTKEGSILFPKNEYAVAGLASGYIITVSHGCRTLWKLTGTKFERIFPKKHSPCDLQFLEGSPCRVLVRSPHQPDQIVELNGSIVQSFPAPVPLRLVSGGFIGRDHIPMTLVRRTGGGTLRGLLVEAYGSYGSSADRSYPIRWLPWLAAGWALAVISPRGGRDHGDAWWDDARGALNKHVTFEDIVKGIRAAQRVTGVSASNTILYGRSAGGWAAAYVGQHTTNLLGAVYADVPYVDILRTTTNPALPLTTLEYEEFGDPLHHPEHFKALAKISPINTVPSALEGVDRPFVLTRSGLYDSQVATYEVLKWSVHLRAAGWNVAVGLDKKGGHFAKESDARIQYAEDAAILDSLIGYSPPKRGASHTVKSPRSTKAR